jgi:hypothetical protein
LPKVLLSALSSLALSPDAILKGFGIAAMRDDQYRFFRPNRFDDDLLRQIVALVPDQPRAQGVLERYLETRTAADDNPRDARQHCSGQNPTSTSTPECAWWFLVSMVG